MREVPDRPKTGLGVGIRVLLALGVWGIAVWCGWQAYTIFVPFHLSTLLSFHLDNPYLAGGVYLVACLVLLWGGWKLLRG